MTKNLIAAQIKRYKRDDDFNKINKQNLKKHKKLKMMKLTLILGLTGVAIGVPLSHSTIQPTQLAQTKQAPAFQEVDGGEHGDGFISRDELRTFVDENGILVDDVDEAFDNVNTNGDGYITPDEWDEAFKNMPPPPPPST